MEKQSGPRLEEPSSDSDSSKANLDDFERAPTARACRRKRRLEEEQRLSDLVKRNGSFAEPDAGEATAPHRIRHLRDRVRVKTAYRELLAAAAPPAGPAQCANQEGELACALPDDPDLAPPQAKAKSSKRARATAAASAAQHLPQCLSSVRSRPLKAKAGSNAFTAGETNAAGRALLGSVAASSSLPHEAPRPPSEGSTGVLARPTRASRTSQAAQRRATAAAVASLLS